jgi:hypothetical protein
MTNVMNSQQTPTRTANWKAPAAVGNARSAPASTAASGATRMSGASGQPTHDVFDVLEREGQKAFWKKVGAVYDKGDGCQTVMIFDVERGTAQRVLELVAIDRVRRPIRPFGDPRRFPTHDLTVGEGKGLHRVGVAFLNKDGSLSLVVDDGLRDGPKQRFQMRIRRERRSRQA